MAKKKAKKGKKKMTSLKEFVKEFGAEQKKLKEKLQEAGQGALKAAFIQLFDKYPNLTALKWAQYTPYFNDGDACTFRVNGLYAKLEDTPEDAGDYEDGFVDPYDLKGQMKKDVEELEDLLQSDVLESTLELLFDDHVEVTATRKGFSVEEYSHD